MSESMSWTEVRRSTPAEYVKEVPDEATVYACWVDGPRHVTVYSGEGTYYIVLGDEEETKRVIQIHSGDVEAVATEIRDDWEEYAGGKSVTQVHAYLNAGGTATISADTVEEARTIITDNVVGEVKTLTVNGIEVSIRFDALPEFELVRGEQ